MNGFLHNATLVLQKAVETTDWCELNAGEAAALSARLSVLEQAAEALREIADQDPIELALDPTWAQRIAAHALLGLAGLGADTQESGV